MRNALQLLIDRTIKARPRLRPGGHQLVRGFGRGIVVRRKQGPGGFIGLGALAVGAAGTVWDNMDDFSPEGIGRVGVIVGVILICYGRLERRTAANDQSYRLGYDIGREDGYKSGHAVARPVVVDLSECRRCGCHPGKHKVLTSAGNVVDRG